MPSSEAAARGSLRSLASFWPQRVMAQKTKRSERVWLLSGAIPIIYLHTVTPGLQYRNILRYVMNVLYTLKPKIQTKHCSRKLFNQRIAFVPLWNNSNIPRPLDGLKTDPPTHPSTHPYALSWWSSIMLYLNLQLNSSSLKFCMPSFEPYNQSTVMP